MKYLISAFIGLIIATVVVASPLAQKAASKSPLLGAKQCTWGPSYWCSNITNAKNCGAVKHCIKTVWEKHEVPVDNDSICKICLDMVTQARDQLESNQTQADLKAVFEGSCNLIPIKLVRKECDKLADDFVPELIETLASEMNPQQVCSVAGLCNNVNIDKLLETSPKTNGIIVVDASKSESEDLVSTTGFTCEKCNSIATTISDKFHSTDRDTVLENILRACGQMSTFSDACSNYVLTYFNEIYDHVEKNLNAESICHLSGTCSAKFHQHPEMVEVRPMGKVGVVAVEGNDIPCELCEQLVQHLRDVLIANTTELEFKEVLEGFCKQTHGFTKECLSITDQYYDVIYKSLVNNLDPNGMCFMIGICQKGKSVNIDGPIMPLVRPDVKITALKTGPIPMHKKILGQDEPKFTAEEIQQFQLPPMQHRFVLGQNEAKLSKAEVDMAQLPIDQLIGAPLSLHLVENGQWCTMCEYFLHFVQESLSVPKNEDEIKRVVSETCDKLPNAIIGQCHNFIELYGDAIIALLIQEVDPREMCPMLKMCPKDMQDVDVFAPTTIDVSIGSGDKPSCPMCLFAITEAKEVIKNEKTKEKIKHTLNSLCKHLPLKLQMECKDFVETYTAELVEMLMNDFTPQEICVYLKSCTDQTPDMSLINLKLRVEKSDDVWVPIRALGNGDIETNEIPDDTVNGQLKTSQNVDFVKTPECLLCQEMVKEVEKKIVNKKSRADIKNALEHACDRLRKGKAKCEKYIEEHGDRIIDLLLLQLSPKEICRDMMFCVAMEDDLEVDDAVSYPSYVSAVTLKKTESDVYDGPQCVICEFVMARLEKDLADKKTQEEIKNTVLSVCARMPKSVANKCKTFIDQYANLVIAFIDTMPPKEICGQLDLCDKKKLDGKMEIVECAVCQGAVQSLDILIKDKAIDTKIENLLEKSCEAVPAKYHQQCESMMQTYGASVVNLLTSLVESHKVCAEIGLCFPDQHSGFVQMSDEAEIFRPLSTTTSKPKLLGAPDKKCSYGPSYWCESKDTAAECNALQFCVDHKLGKWMV